MSEGVAHHNHGELDDHHVKTAPRSRPTNGSNCPFNGTGDALDRVSHGCLTVL
jgi:hypothetical protein